MQPLLDCGATLIGHPGPARAPTAAGDGRAVPAQRCAKSGASAYVGIRIATTGITTLVGPLGIAIALGLLGYTFFKLAEGVESTSLERWARRCVFGHGNENPPVHWNKPKQAATTISELNAATLGMEAGINFRLRIAGSDAHGVGGPLGSVTAPMYEQHLEYWLALPYFNESRSAYCWSLIVHRYGDGAAARYTGGEVVTGDSFNIPSITTPGSVRRTTLAEPNLPKFPDYRKDTATPTTNTHLITLSDGRPMQIKAINGTLALLPDLRKHNIEAATLIVTYRPDRNIPNAFAKTLLMDNQ